MKEKMIVRDRVEGIVALLIFLVIAELLFGCSKGPTELGEQIRGEMQSVYAAKPGMSDLEMKGVYLVADGENAYRGVGVGVINGREVRFLVKCRREGSTVLWGADLESVTDEMIVAGERLNDVGRCACEKLAEARVAGDDAYRKAKTKACVYGSKIKKSASVATAKLRNATQNVRVAVGTWWGRLLDKKSENQTGITTKGDVNENE